MFPFTPIDSPQASSALGSWAVSGGLAVLQTRRTPRHRQPFIAFTFPWVPECHAVPPHRQPWALETLLSDESGGHEIVESVHDLFVGLPWATRNRKLTCFRSKWCNERNVPALSYTGRFSVIARAAWQDDAVQERRKRKKIHKSSEAKRSEVKVVSITCNVQKLSTNSDALKCKIQEEPIAKQQPPFASMHPQLALLNVRLFIPCRRSPEPSINSVGRLHQAMPSIDPWFYASLKTNHVAHQRRSSSE